MAASLGLDSAVADLPGTGPMGIDLATWLSDDAGETATTRGGQTTLGADSTGPLGPLIEAHEAIHRQQHDRWLGGETPSTREALEEEARTGSRALVAGRGFEAKLASSPGMTLSFTDDASNCSVVGDNDVSLDGVVQAISLRLAEIGKLRLAAVTDLDEDVDKVDSPTWVEGLLLSTTEIALSSCSAALAARLVRGTEGSLGEGLAEAVAAGLQVAPGVLARHLSQSGDASDAFFRTQRDALIGRSSDEVIKHILANHFDAEPDPIAAAMQSLRSTCEALEFAYRDQQQASLSAWCAYLAQVQCGTNDTSGFVGADLDVAVSDVAALDVARGAAGGRVDGALYLAVKVPERPGRELVVESATLEGLNEGLRSALQGIPLKELKIPIIVHAVMEPWAEYMRCLGWLGAVGAHVLQGGANELSVGRNSAGTVWNHSGDLGNAFLVSMDEARFRASDPRELEAAANLRLPLFFGKGIFDASVASLGIPLAGTFADRMRGDE